MSKEDEFNKKLAEDLKQIAKESYKPGTPELESFLVVGYPKVKNREHAQEIIEGWKKDHSSYPYELKEDAIAFLEALDKKPSPKDNYHPPTDRLGQLIQAESPGRS